MMRSTRATTATSTRASRSAEKQRHPSDVASPARSPRAAARPSPTKSSPRTSVSTRTSPRSGSRRQKDGGREKQNGRAADSDGGSSMDEELPGRSTRGSVRKRAHGNQESPRAKKNKLTKVVRNGITENGVGGSSEEEESPRITRHGKQTQASGLKESSRSAKSQNQSSKKTQIEKRPVAPQKHLYTSKEKDEGLWGKDDKGAEGKDDKGTEGKDEKGTEEKDDKGTEVKVGKETIGKDDKRTEGKDDKDIEGIDDKRTEGKDNKRTERKDNKRTERKDDKRTERKDDEDDEGTDQSSVDDDEILSGLSADSIMAAMLESDDQGLDVEEISSDSEENADEGDDEDEDEDEVQFMGVNHINSLSSREKYSRTEDISNNDMSKLLKTMKKEYEDLVKQKDEEIVRLRNHLKYKDQQMDSMNDLVNQNMELEAKISAILGSPEIYEEEVKKLAEEKSKSPAGKKKSSANEQENEEDDVQNKNNKGKKKDTPIDVDAQDSDSIIEVVDEKREKKQRSVQVIPDEEEDEEEEEEEEKNTGKKGRKRPRRSRRTKVVEEEEGEKIEALFVSDDEDEDIKEIMRPSKKKTRAKKGEKAEDDEEAAEKKTKDTKEGRSDKEDDGTDDKGRHNIRRLMGDKKLAEETKAAAIEEKERLQRVAKLKEKHQVVSHIDPKTKQPVYTKLVLAFKKDQKTPLVEVNTKVLKKLKPHQVDAVEFLWDSVIENTERLKEDQTGSGCIIAHCMGLGKTLSVISFVHTLLTHKILKLTTCLVVCPLNTVLNWQFEWSKWLDKKDRLPTYELASAKDNQTRANILNKWHKEGGILIMGYQLFRILATSTTKSKKKKKIFDDTLIEQGADIIVCDEGHVLKNDASAISKCMNKIRSKRRIVLTGTPLQNNLIEYHCMVSFVKPNLLGTRKEFCNRFVNPITNGQHADSTPFDVKVMKRRAHVLHKMLSGCVQRRDYSSLTKFLPPKYEYIVSIRLSPLQMKLYEKYLDQYRNQENLMFRGTSLFSDYQVLMRIWTHPWVLKMDEIRQEKKMMYTEDDDDELGSFLASDTSEAEETSEDVESEARSSSDTTEKEVEKEVEKEPEPTSRRTRRSTSAAQEAEKKSSTEAEKKGGKQNNNGKQNGNGKQNNNDKAENKNKKVVEDSDSDLEEIFPDGTPRKARLIAGEVIKHWQTESRRRGVDETNPEPRKPEEQWWTPMVNEEEHKTVLELSGKLVVLMDILRMAEGLGDKVLLFSQSLLSLDLIEDFLGYKNEEAEKLKEGKKGKSANDITMWKKDEDFCRMDGSTSVTTRTKFTNTFNCTKNKRMRLFLISTKAGGLGINLESANRVIIFDASWNPSHDIQSIFRAYRFGQDKEVFIYRFLAQGTMEEKIYERQVQKETLAQRVIDEHQLDSHFTASDLQDLYKFEPDRLDDPDRKERPTPKVPKDIILAELLSERKDWIVGYHEHDSLLETRPEENLNEEECKAAWEDYEKEKQGFMYQYRQPMPAMNNINTFNYTYRPNSYMQRYPPGETRAPILPPGSKPYPKAIHPTPSLQSTPAIRDALSALSTSGGGMLPLAAPPAGFTDEQAKLNFQLSQLPRVVQEILKYNPEITPTELQTRLRAFMGMHTRYSNIPGFAMLNQAGMLGQPEVALPSTTASNSYSSSNSGFPAQAAAAAAAAMMDAPVLGAQSSWSGTSTPSPAQLSQAITSTIAAATSSVMPSRLPQPGRVPANQR